MKTKSGAKKRFKFSARGKLKHGQAGKRHGMIKRSNEQIRELRGTTVMSASETDRKSTRLNSSHTVISYAVFCLKKKKKNKKTLGTQPILFKCLALPGEDENANMLLHGT